jgi:hypothetical protein
MASLNLDGHSYTVTPMPTKLGLRTFVRVGKMIGPGFMRLASGGFGQKDIASAEFGALIGDLFDRLDDPNLEAVVETIMDTVQEDGRPMSQRWMAEFSGKIGKLSKILIFAIQAHFGDFMSAFGSEPNSSASEAAKAKT